MFRGSRNLAIKLIIFLVAVEVILQTFENLACQTTKEDEWCFLNTSAIGAKQFLQKYPHYDGRGTVIFILDGGIDMGVAGLKVTSTGQTKVIDVRDFSGQGEVLLFLGKQNSAGLENFIEHPDGFRLHNYHLLN